MNGNSREWIAVGLFFVVFFAFSIAEAFYLSKRVQQPAGRTFSYAFVTNVFSITIGFFASFVVFALIIAMAWGGSIDQFPAGSTGLWAAIGFSAIFPVVLLTLAKRFAGKLFKFDAISWVYSLTASVLFMVAVLAAPILYSYFT